MNHAEAAYFDGVPVQHVADWHERERIARIERKGAEARRRNGRNGR